MILWSKEMTSLKRPEQPVLRLYRDCLRVSSLEVDRTEWQALFAAGFDILRIFAASL